MLDRRWEAESPGLKERAVQLRARRKNIKRFVDEGDYLRFTGRVNELIGRVATRQRYSEKGVEEMKREMAALEKIAEAFEREIAVLRSVPSSPRLMRADSPGCVDCRFLPP